MIPVKDGLLPCPPEKNRVTLTALLLINDQKVRFQVDTGADEAKKTSHPLNMWNKTNMTPDGEATIKLQSHQPKN